MFDPMATAFDGPEGITRPGEYLIAFVYFHGGIQTSRGGHPFIRCKAEVLCGDASGATLWESVYLHRKAHKRLASLCRAMGVTDPFDPADEEQLRATLMGRPLLVSVAIEERGAYRDPKIVRFCGRPFSEAEQAAAAAFVQTVDGDVIPY